ncbi:C40 family peptidase [Thermosinus carboxydivorans]|nr:C40 family peptidase [Thermosinus carboxydivorans]
MRKLIIATVFAVTLGSTGTAMAVPAATTYDNFLKTLDSIINEAVLPVPEEIVTAKAWEKNQAVVSIAKTMLGQPVVWGGASPGQGFDCSGLVQYVFRQAGISLPRTADRQFLVGQPVAKSALEPGDLVFFTTYEPGASHVGIYIGADKFVHTSWSQGVVAIGDMKDDYFVKRYYGAKRVI